MANINIYEEDYTSPGNTRYENFSVLVPGRVKEGESYGQNFDDFGVQEFTNVADFVKEVGLVNSGANSEKDIPAVSFSYISEIAADRYYTKIEEEYVIADEALEAGADGSYTKAQLSAAYFKTKEATEQEPAIYTSVLDYYFNNSKLATATAKTASDPKYGKYGYMNDLNNNYDFITSAESIKDDTKIYIIDFAGSNEVENRGHYGNQIAYELLKLGYTVVYKKLDTIQDLANYSYFEELEDKATYDFRYIITGLRSNNTSANINIAQLAKTRGDCTAILDIDEDSYTSDSARVSTSALATAISQSIQGVSGADKYSEFIGPTCEFGVEVKSEFNQNRTLPASLYYLACALYSRQNNYQEWYAVAGYLRGISNISIIAPLVKFGENLSNILAPRIPGVTTKSANLIVKIKNNYYLWGNRTAETLVATGLTANHFLNIRQLCTSLKKELYVVLRRLTYNPNNIQLWVDFCSLVTPTLENMKTNNGIKDYRLIRVETSIKGKMEARIRIIPIEAVEDFDIYISLEDSFDSVQITD